MIMGSYLCIKNRESEDSDIVWGSSTEYFNRQQLEEATMVQRRSFDIQMPNNEFVYTSENDGESVISPSLEVLFRAPFRKIVPVNDVPKISPYTDLNQLPLKRSSVIYPAFNHQRKTTDESLVQCIVLNSHRPGNQYVEEPSLSKEGSGEEMTEIKSEISELTPSLIFRDYRKKKKYPRVKARSLSLDNFKRKRLLKIRARSHSPNRGRTLTKPQILPSITMSESSWRPQGNLENSDLDSTVHNSIYGSGSESTFQWDDDCVWATFVPVTPKPDCETSMSKTERTSMRTSQLSLLETIKNNRMEERKTKEKINFTISTEESGRQLELAYDAAVQAVIV